MHQFDNLVVIHGLSQFPGNCFELVEVDFSITISIVESKYSFDSIFRFGLSHPPTDHFNELIEGNESIFSLQVRKHGKDSFIPSAKAELFQNFVDLRRVDAIATILVEKIESGFEFLLVLLGDHFLPIRALCSLAPAFSSHVLSNCWLHLNVII